MMPEVLKYHDDEIHLVCQAIAYEFSMIPLYFIQYSLNELMNVDRGGAWSVHETLREDKE